MSADDYPDYDLSFLDGTTGSDLAAMGKGLDSAATDLQKNADDLNGNAKGQTVERVHGDLVSIKQSLDDATDHATAAAAAFAAMKAAWDTWKANAPKQAEIAAAEQAVAHAREQLKSADNHHAGLARAALKRAQDTLRDLIAKREAADAALVEALEKAKAQLKRSRVHDHGKPLDDGPGAPAHTAPPPKSAPKSSPAPGSETSETPAPTSAPAPAAPAPPTTLSDAPAAAAPAPETSPSSTTGGSGLSPATAAALGAALSQQGQQQQAPPQMPMMPQVPMAAQQQNTKPAGEQNRNGDGVIGTDDILKALGPAAAAAAALPLGAAGLSAGSNMSPVTVASPAISPNPTFLPAAPWSPAGSGSGLSAPAINPVTTGTSVSGLLTDNNVSGRPDNVASRSAYAPNPGATSTASHLAGAQSGGGSAASGTATGSATAGAPGAGMPMMPMMPMGGAGGAAGGSQRDPVTAKLTPEQQELMGLPTVAASVAGGTIAQRGVAGERS